MSIKIPQFTSAHVIVVGDVMLDRYWHGETMRISPEAPVPIVRVQQSEERPGGAGNVALNLTALDCTTSLFGLCGKDEAGQLLENKLLAAGITCFFHRDEQFPTVTKLRVLSQHQQLIRLDFEEPWRSTKADNLLLAYQQQLKHAQVVILSDYAKGTLADPQPFIQLARKAKVPVFIDPKGTDYQRYQGATMLTPNRKEFEAVVGVCHSEHELYTKGIELLQKLELEALLITRGEQGMTLLRANCPELHLPAFSHEVYDVTGAGDTVIATLAAAVAAGSDLETAINIANHAASIVVGKLGAATVNIAELRRTVQKDKRARGIVNEEQLLLVLDYARANGERIVVTNGCFDIIHAGHIAYLEQAKQLGDRLIVAVNEDDSVKRLKGSERPINTLARRMAVLAGLSAVDWVISFSEDTPERIIQAIKPDVLVKGGDYKIEQIAGAAFTMANGGEVKILNYIDNCSTSHMIEKIRGA
ncbi:MAG: hldE [Gammaproteobacteria bacterium]|jgi:D-beta-D-heptose 7-phosphate kinase/D-beta-D-heptose 1-phosphate adenosyltransferase|nr:hldE [Gammaproteobacteria bacterium]